MLNTEISTRMYMTWQEMIDYLLEIGVNYDDDDLDHMIMGVSLGGYDYRFGGPVPTKIFLKAVEQKFPGTKRMRPEERHAEHDRIQAENKSYFKEKAERIVAEFDSEAREWRKTYLRRTTPFKDREEAEEWLRKKAIARDAAGKSRLAIFEINVWLDPIEWARLRVRGTDKQKTAHLAKLLKSNGHVMREVPSLLKYLDPEGDEQAIVGYFDDFEDNPIIELREKARRMAERSLSGSEAQWADFILTGNNPYRPADAEYRQKRVLARPEDPECFEWKTVSQRILMSVDPATTPTEVGDFYASARRQFLSPKEATGKSNNVQRRVRRPAEKTLALLHFVAKHQGEGRSMAEIQERWNEAYPDGAYEKLSVFQSTYSRAKKKYGELAAF